MNIRKIFLIGSLCSVFLLVTFLLSSCSSKDSLALEDKLKFPMDDRGYPKNDVVLINRKEYSIDLESASREDKKVDTEVQIHTDDKSDEIELILPQYLPINFWSFEEKNLINIVDYELVNYPIKDENMVEGISSSVQKFIIHLPDEESTEIYFKWANIDETKKLFKDRKEDYLLKLVVSP
ncbi:MAG: hypothetical protein SOW41_06710 [Anaerococcus sp.]|nr:hypothetical protein [Peptoniphilaceae bacterium]MDY3055724.1 hypothetical protein [Anaerococcus sp.]